MYMKVNIYLRENVIMWNYFIWFEFIYRCVWLFWINIIIIFNNLCMYVEIVDNMVFLCVELVIIG